MAGRIAPQLQMAKRPWVNIHLHYGRVPVMHYDMLGTGER